MQIYAIFKSIQGEGLTIGEPTVFIRTAGCPLRCRWCDEPGALEERRGVPMTVDAIVARVRELGGSQVCLTGGEPLHQPDAVELIKRLLDERYVVDLETSGSISLEPLPDDERLIVSMDLKCPGSGMERFNLFENIPLLGPGDQLKFIIADEADYEYAREALRKHPPRCAIIFTPVGGKELRWLAERVLADGLQVRVLPQLHKFIWEDVRNR